MTDTARSSRRQPGAAPRWSAHLTLAFLLLLVTFTRCHGNPQPPNILLMMADDLGYGDLGCYGNTSLRTPHLDKLASQGMRLTQSIAAASLCTPSRAAFMTGRYPIRSGMAPPGLIRVPFITATGTGLPASQLTVAEVAKQAGYSTALLGKWHLGWSVDSSNPDHHHPLNQGFDYFYGIPLTNIRDFDAREKRVWVDGRPDLLRILTLTCVLTLVSTLLVVRVARLGRAGTTVAVVVMVTVILTCALVFWVLSNLTLLNSFLYRNYDMVEQPINLPQVTRKLVREGVHFLEERAKDGRPFLLFVSWLHTHTALATGPDFRGRSQHGLYGDAVEELDWGVGQLLQTLDRLGQTGNTLVYFTSDNGGHQEERDFTGHMAGGHNGLLKGGKGHGAPEGGIRVPTIVRWPGTVPAGHVTDEPVSQMDVMPTVARALRVQLPASLVLDGRDLSPLLRGEEGASGHEFMFHYCGSQVHAVRFAPRHGERRVWKLVLYEPNYLPDTHHCHFMCRCYEATPLDPPPIFDLTSDPGEQRPLLSEDLPEYRHLVQTMQTALEEHERSVEHVPNMFTLPQLLWRPWQQPVCRFPHFQCNDPHFQGVFDDDEE